MSTSGYSEEDKIYLTLEEEIYSNPKKSSSFAPSSLMRTISTKCSHPTIQKSCKSCSEFSDKSSDKSCNKSCDKKLTNIEKWLIALFLAILFVIISSPALYGITDGISRVLCLPPTSKGQGPTLYGLFIHFLIFFLVIRLLLENDKFFC